MIDEKFLKSMIRDVKDYPKNGILFRDITPLIKDSRALAMCIDGLAELVNRKRIDYVVGIESRGFIFGTALAHRLGKGFIPIRKKGKLPYKTISRDYDLEYGSSTLEMHSDAIEKDNRVLIVDDLLATGGTAKAAAELIEQAGGKIVALEFVVELSDLKGSQRLDGHDVISLLKY